MPCTDLSLSSTEEARNRKAAGSTGRRRDKKQERGEGKQRKKREEGSGPTRKCGLGPFRAVFFLRLTFGNGREKAQETEAADRGGGTEGKGRGSEEMKKRDASPLPSASSPLPVDSFLSLPSFYSACRKTSKLV